MQGASGMLSGGFATKQTELFRPKVGIASFIAPPPKKKVGGRGGGGIFCLLGTAKLSSILKFSNPLYVYYPNILYSSSLDTGHC
jgi:hypothetical protein